MFVTPFGSPTNIKIFSIVKGVMLSLEQLLRYKIAVCNGKDCPFGKAALIARVKGPATDVVLD